MHLNTTSITQRNKKGSRSQWISQFSHLLGHTVWGSVLFIVFELLTLITLPDINQNVSNAKLRHERLIPRLVFFPPTFPPIISFPSTLFKVPVGNENQQVVQQQYQQQVMVPVSQSVQGPMPVYYSVITPTQQNSTRYVQNHWDGRSRCISVIILIILQQHLCASCGHEASSHFRPLFFVSVLQPISRLPATPQLWAVSNHAVAIPLQPSTVTAAIFRWDCQTCTVVLSRTCCDH